MPEIKLKAGIVVDPEVSGWRSVPGWFSHDAPLTLLISTYQVRSVLEIGVLFGRATAFFCEQPTVESVTAVDPFKPFFWGDKPEGEDRMREIFNENMSRLGLYRPGGPLQVAEMPSASFFSRWNDPYDLVYIDGDHAREAIRGDLDSGSRVARKILCGDDFDTTHPAMCDEVLRFQLARPDIWLPIEITGNFWWTIRRSAVRELRGGAPKTP